GVTGLSFLYASSGILDVRVSPVGGSLFRDGPEKETKKKGTLHPRPSGSLVAPEVCGRAIHGPATDGPTSCRSPFGLFPPPPAATEGTGCKFQALCRNTRFHLKRNACIERPAKPDQSLPWT